ncbi:chromate efflux transporter [Corynebacterium epidermidicanis]|uniref:chromate efflux transporter n=1 Tax=Corynebacterium epidermidicanis TaxID=1050174 RepID=UPI0011876E09
MGDIWEIARTFTRLGLTSFGGPTAHLGYFKDTFVDKLRWMSEAEYARTVALCQFLPGPASSQVGMAIGYRKAGLGGLFAAWLAFTAPSALALGIFGLGVDSVDLDQHRGLLAGLLAAAVAVVFHAVSTMARSLASTPFTATISVTSALAVLLVPSAITQVAIIVGAATIGVFLSSPRAQDTYPNDPTTGHQVGSRTAWLALVILVGLLLILPVATRLTPSHVLAQWAAFFQSGALVFGGGHVVLPLLEQHTVQQEWVTAQEFLAGYSAAQAVPGPLFTFASYLGAVDSGVVGAIIATLAIFAPSVLLVLVGMHWWDRLQRFPRVSQGVAAVNAAVVGLLAAALYDPVFTHGVTGPASLCVAALSWLGLTQWHLPAWAVAVGAALVGAVVL